VIVVVSLLPASLLVPFGNVLAQATGSWQSVFLVAAAMNLVAALAAPFVLRPLRMRHQARRAAQSRPETLRHSA
jgi:OFA family oxalate/formate antiporter-like MFS transporter